jgi:hypothetical protein
LGGFFNFFPYDIQHCFICRPSNSTVPTDAGIKSRTVATGIVGTGGKFAAGVVDTGGNLPPVSLTPVANLPPVSLTPVVHLDLRISPRIFEKIRNGPNGILWGWGETDS